MVIYMYGFHDKRDTYYYDTAYKVSAIGERKIYYYNVYKVYTIHERGNTTMVALY